MKHEDVPGYTELRSRLFQLRFRLQVLKNEEERSKVREELKEVKKQMARLLYDDLESKKKGK